MDDVTSPYSMFKYSIRTELTRKYYERRRRTFFDFIEFMVGSPIEVRFNLFAEKAKSDTHRAIVHIISFLQYEKESSERRDYCSNTLQLD